MLPKKSLWYIVKLVRVRVSYCLLKCEVYTMFCTIPMCNFDASLAISLPPKTFVTNSKIFAQYVHLLDGILSLSLPTYSFTMASSHHQAPAATPTAPLDTMALLSLGGPTI